MVSNYMQGQGYTQWNPWGQAPAAYRQAQDPWQTQQGGYDRQGGGSSPGMRSSPSKPGASSNPGTCSSPSKLGVRSRPGARCSPGKYSRGTSAARTFGMGMGKGVNWGITSQTGVHATLSGTSGTANILTIPANYRGTVNIRVTSGATIRNFRVVVRR